MDVLQGTPHAVSYLVLSGIMDVPQGTPHAVSYLVLSSTWMYRRVHPTQYRTWYSVVGATLSVVGVASCVPSSVATAIAAITAVPTAVPTTTTTIPCKEIPWPKVLCVEGAV